MIKLVKAVKCAFDYNQFTIHAVTLQSLSIGYIFLMEQVERAYANPCRREAC